MHPQFSTEFELKGAMFENRYVLCWNTRECDSYESSNSVVAAKDKRFIFAHLCDNNLETIIYIDDQNFL